MVAALGRRELKTEWRESTLVTREHSRQKPEVGSLAGKRQGSIVRFGLAGPKAQSSFEDETGA